MKLYIISYPKFFQGEALVVANILAGVDCVFHLRKPDATDEEFDKFMSQIPSLLHNKIFLHSAYHLREKYNVGGLHFSTAKRSLAKSIDTDLPKSTSCHSIDEVKQVEQEFDSCFLAPVYPSISKKGYSGDLDIKEISDYLNTKPSINVVALGGISVNNLAEVQSVGFSGAAVLGTVWGANPVYGNDFTLKIHELIRSIEKPYCLSVAGFDPSAGAGVLSDVKSFEANGCYGLGVNSANTYQNDSEFDGLEWVSVDSIKAQIKPLSKYPVKAIKIGLIESLGVLEDIIIYIKQIFPDAFIVWDPILKATAGYEFHSDVELSNSLVENIDLITPNADEFKQMNLGKHKGEVNILLKGGHRVDNPGTDTLFIAHKEIDIDGSEFKDKKDKHGTGCVLSSVIAANIACGDTLEDASRKAKKYIEDFIMSNSGRLGWHNY